MSTWTGRPVEEKNILYFDIDTNINSTFRREGFVENKSFSVECADGPGAR